MGFFSWKTQDTGRSIANKYSNRSTFSVRMTDNSGNEWIEDDYEGYGEFGGKDFYELLAEMNGKESSRDEGVTMTEAHFTDDLKANFRSWEYDHNDITNAELLTLIMQQRHPDEDPDVVRVYCYDWIGL